MNDEQAAIDELEAARSRHRARQAGRDALAMISAAAADDMATAERIALTVESPGVVAYAAGCYAGGILQAFAALSDDPTVTESVLERLTHQVEEMEL